ncbi:unnamed protein product [Amoebophrya sp. A25]|nr:unnamed protein product [Amoebophrya sp. A25]|eukprot:GSA25T00017870001.1
MSSMAAANSSTPPLASNLRDTDNMMLVQGSSATATTGVPLPFPGHPQQHLAHRGHYQVSMLSSNKKHRIQSMDVFRGFVMIVMCWDHTQEFLMPPGDPKDSGSEMWSGPLKTYDHSVSEFFARWVSHICAPGFFLTMGIGMYLFTHSRMQRGTLPRTYSIRDCACACCSCGWRCLKRCWRFCCSRRILFGARAGRENASAGGEVDANATAEGEGANAGSNNAALVAARAGSQQNSNSGNHLSSTSRSSSGDDDDSSGSRIPMSRARSTYQVDGADDDDTICERPVTIEGYIRRYFFLRGLVLILCGRVVNICEVGWVWLLLMQGKPVPIPFGPIDPALLAWFPLVGIWQVLVGLGMSMIIAGLFVPVLFHYKRFGALFLTLLGFAVFGLSSYVIVTNQDPGDAAKDADVFPRSLYPANTWSEVALRFLILPGRTAFGVVAYPLCPWVGVVLLGMVLGSVLFQPLMKHSGSDEAIIHAGRTNGSLTSNGSSSSLRNRGFFRKFPHRSKWLEPILAIIGVQFLALFMFLRFRLPAEYAKWFSFRGSPRGETDSPFEGKFTFCKYPPDVCFLLFTTGVNFLLWAFLSTSVTGSGGDENSSSSMRGGRSSSGGRVAEGAAFSSYNLDIRGESYHIHLRDEDIGVISPHRSRGGREEETARALRTDLVVKGTSSRRSGSPNDPGDNSGSEDPNGGLLFVDGRDLPFLENYNTGSTAPTISPPSTSSTLDTDYSLQHHPAYLQSQGNSRSRRSARWISSCLARWFFFPACLLRSMRNMLHLVVSFVGICGRCLQEQGRIARRCKREFASFLNAFGQVPLFFYMTHYMALSLFTIVVKWVNNPADPGSGPEWPRIALLPIWLGVVLLLRKPCEMYNVFKRRTDPDSLWRLF